MSLSIKEQILSESPWLQWMSEEVLETRISQREKANIFSFETGIFQWESPVIYWYDNDCHYSFIDGKWHSLREWQVQDEVEMIDKEVFASQFPWTIQKVEQEREFRMTVESTMKDILYPENIEKTFLAKITKYTLDEQQKIKNALELARTKHTWQMRDEWTDYISHCVLVASLLVDGWASADEIIIGLLHDTREDTDITDDDFIPYGEVVSVWTLKLSKKRDWAKIPMEQYLSELQEDERWIKIKWADRLWNIFSLHYCPDETKRIKYIKETREILLPIFYKHSPEFARKIDIVLSYVISHPELSQEELARLNGIKKITQIKSTI